MPRDDSLIRLFIFHLQQKGLNIQQVHQIKKKLYMMKSMNELFVLKGFESKRKLLFQYEFTRKLLQRSTQTLYYFDCFPNGERYVKWNQYYWAKIPYIHGYKINFTKRSDQIDVFRTLNQFHRLSAGIQLDSEYLSVRRLYPYYEQRLQTFIRWLDYFPSEQMPMFEEIKQWGMHALKKLSEEPLEQMERKALLNWQWTHGDVAHHNFLRTEDRKVVIIDFDLVSIGPKEYDELQLSQRILCCNGWNIAEWFHTMNGIVKTLVKQRWFLWGLMFPNDIYREWNYLFQNKAWSYMDTLLTYTKNQYNARLPFMKEMMRMVN